MRLNVQLIVDAENGQHVWVDRFDLALAEPFPMQRDVVARLIPPLHAHLLAASGRTPQPAPAVLAPQPRAGAPAGRGETVAHPRGGTVVYPRGATPPPSVLAAAPAPSRARRASSPPQQSAAAPAPRPPAQPARRPFRIPLWIKLLVIAVAGAAAAVMLGAERRSVVEIVSWMLIAAGSIQLIGALTAGPREDWRADWCWCAPAGRAARHGRGCPR